MCSFSQRGVVFFFCVLHHGTLDMNSEMVGGVFSFVCWGFLFFLLEMNNIFSFIRKKTPTVALQDQCACMVFVKTIELSLAVQRWIQDHPDLKILKPGRIIGSRVGGMFCYQFLWMKRP